MIDIIGYIGSLAYAICGLPQAYLSIKNGNSEGISRAYGWLSLIGSALSLVYAIPVADYILMTNFGFNIIVWSIILKYSYYPRGV